MSSTQRIRRGRLAAVALLACGALAIAAPTQPALAAPMVSQDQTALPPFGDYTGDGRPDHIVVGTAADPGIWLYPATDTAGHVGTRVQVGEYGTGFTHTTADWIGTTVSPMELDGDGLQDLLIRLPYSGLPGNGMVIPNPGDGGSFRSWEAIALHLYSVDGSGEFQNVDQLVGSPLASVTGFPISDIYAVVGDELYFYPPAFPPGVFQEPVLLGSGWSGRTITAVSVGADPALFARDDATGALTLHIGNAATGTPAGAPGTTVVAYASSGFDAAAAPKITGSDINLDGLPDLWVETSAGTLDAYLNTGAASFAAPVSNPL